MKRRQLILGAALAASAALAALGNNTPEPRLAEPVTRASAASQPVASVHAAVGDSAILRLQTRDGLTGDSGDAFKAGDDQLFAAQNWTPPPPPPTPASPPPPPMAPPLPFTYMGKSVGQGRWEVYLMRGDQAWVVREQDVIDGSWRVESIAPPVMTLTYLPLNQVKQLNIGVFD